MKRLAKWLAVIAVAFVVLVAPVDRSEAALGKGEITQPMEWTKITNTGDSAGIKSTGVIDVSGSYDTVLGIDWCLAEAAAHEGTEIIVQFSTESGANDAWITIAQFVTSSGITPIKADFANQEAASQTVLGVTNPETQGVDHDGKFIFLEDTVTPANCEIAYQIDNSGDAGDTITVLDGITAQKETTSDVWTVDTFGVSLVDTYAIRIPSSAKDARVIFNNWYDNDGTGADGYGRVRAIEMTGL